MSASVPGRTMSISVPGPWPCPFCKMLNEPALSRCRNCDLARHPTPSVASPSTDDIPPNFDPSGGETWNCNACSLENAPAAERCLACSVPKDQSWKEWRDSVRIATMPNYVPDISGAKTQPESKKSEDKKPEKKKKSGGLLAAFKKSRRKEEEPPNIKAPESHEKKTSAPTLNLLGRQEPQETKPPAPTLNLMTMQMAGLAAGGDEWDCPSCTLKNRGCDSCCSVCDCPRPTGLKTVRKASIDPGLPTGPWKCPRCTLDNTAKAVYCKACGQPRNPACNRRRPSFAPLPISPGDIPPPPTRAPSPSPLGLSKPPSMPSPPSPRSKKGGRNQLPYFDRAENYYYQLNGFKRNLDKAASYYSMSVEKEQHPRSMVALARFFGTGEAKTIPKDFESMNQLYILAAKRGDSLALGRCHLAGIGPYPKDEVKAFGYFYQCGHQEGEPRAMYWLGMSYSAGLGVDVDEDVSMEWYEKAADAGHPWATRKLYSLMMKRGLIPDA